LTAPGNASAFKPHNTNKHQNEKFGVKHVKDNENEFQRKKLEVKIESRDIYIYIHEYLNDEIL
jgi:hypothetical protein